MNTKKSNNSSKLTYKKLNKEDLQIKIKNMSINNISCYYGDAWEVECEIIDAKTNIVLNKNFISTFLMKSWFDEEYDNYSEYYYEETGKYFDEVEEYKNLDWGEIPYIVDFETGETDGTLHEMYENLLFGSWFEDNEEVQEEVYNNIKNDFMDECRFIGYFYQGNKLIKCLSPIWPVDSGIKQVYNANTERYIYKYKNVYFNLDDNNNFIEYIPESNKVYTDICTGSKGKSYIEKLQ